MKKPGKYLKFYMDHAESRIIPSGLCRALGYGDPYLSLFEPTKRNCTKYNTSNWFFWGGCIGEFNDFRQNIVLFIAAMNGEL